MKGAALAPKRAVDVMAAEVNHMLMLIKNAIVPLPICVPRKVRSPWVFLRMLCKHYKH